MTDGIDPGIGEAKSMAAGAQAVSGRYVEDGSGTAELRLDVDGPLAQMTMSGLIVSGLRDRLHWVAKAGPAGPDRYRGDIWYRDGTDALLPQTAVEVTLDISVQPIRAAVVFSGTGGTTQKSVFRREAASFHSVEFEYGTVEGASPVTRIDTWAHPNRPATLPHETLAIETVFERAGFDVTRSGNDKTIPLAKSGTDGLWSNSEMHDAMQCYWSKFADRPQWALWVLFASRHVDGDKVGGIMFDYIGPRQRQGTAIFTDAFISRAPDGDPAPDASVARQRFWAVCHETGHTFNLAHSWQQNLQRQYWPAMRNESEGRTFMNYPFNVKGGQAAFFENFAYRFSDQELVFMRHAPERFVEMGDAAWFEGVEFKQAAASLKPSLKLDLRVNRAEPVFDFLEPCVVELKLINIGSEPLLVREHALCDAERMVVVIRKEGGKTREWLPYAHYCMHGPKAVLAAGASLYDTVFVGAGCNGWDLSEPGRYSIQILVRIGMEDIVSNPLKIVVRPPRSYDEEVLAQDFFSDDVGRVLAFDGSRFLTKANDILQEAAARLKDRPVASHARIALGKSLIGGGKMLVGSAQDREGLTIQGSSDIPAGAREMRSALFDDPSHAAETLSHVDFKGYGDDLSAALAEIGETGEAAKVQQDLFGTLSERKVAQAVLDQICARRDGYLAQSGKRG